MIDWLYNEKVSLSELAKNYKVSIIGIKKRLERNPEIRKARDYNNMLGKKSRVWLEYKKCKSCDEVKHRSSFPANISKGVRSCRFVVKHVRPECKKCFRERMNPRAHQLGDRKYYVYSILHDSEVIYIGKGTGNRVRVSMQEREGNDYAVLVDELTHHEAIDLERELIEFIGIDNLKNKL